MVGLYVWMYIESTHRSTHTIHTYNPYIHPHKDPHVWILCVDSMCGSLCGCMYGLYVWIVCVDLCVDYMCGLFVLIICVDYMCEYYVWI